MKFLVPNYSCLQNPWLGGYRPQIPVLSVICPQLNLLNPPRKKIPGYATGPYYQFIIPSLLKKRKQNPISGRASKRSSDSRTLATHCKLVLQTSVKVRCQNSGGWRASLCPRFAHSPRTALGLAYYQSWQTCLKVARNIGTRFGNDSNNITRHNPGNIGEVCYSCTYDSLL
jgi:hypothetical protein